MEALRGAKTSQFRDGCITRDAPLALKGHGGGDKRKYGTTVWSEGFNFWDVGEGGVGGITGIQPFSQSGCSSGNKTGHWLYGFVRGFYRT